MNIHDAITKLARSHVLAMTPYSSARTEGEQGESWAHHDANEMLSPPYPGTAEQEGFNRYPDPQPSHLLDAFADIYKVDRYQLLLTRGADEAIDLLIRVFCRENVDGILIHPPTFVMFEHAAHIQGATVFRVPLREDFQLDTTSMLATCRANPNIKLVFACSPNNPTSNLMRRDDVLELARELAGQALVVVDEVYLAYSGQASLSAKIAEHPNLVVMRSLSKDHALAGERCGVLIAHPEVISLAGRILAPYPLSVSAIRSVTAAVSPEGIEYARNLREQILGERKNMEKALRASPAVQHIYPSDTNFLLVRTTDPALLVRMMEENHIKIRDRSNAVPGCVRISIGNPRQNERLLQVFAEYAAKVVR
ncbi:MAG: histidinol-phosphate transaminase [Corynebacteriales bacterium]|nr:histidinol-phosphate transaminase [Mycobacteriales bacterium]